MNQLQSSLFDTMKQFSNHTKETSTAPVTIEGTIKEIKDAGIGLYTVEYLGNEIECSATNGASYLVGDNVYILVPNGDFRKNKLILGLIDVKERQNYIKKEDNIIYYPISNNLATNISIPIPIELSSYGGTQKFTYNLINSSEAERKIFADLINSFIKENNNTFAFSFSIKTLLEKEQQMNGNYGITLKIPCITKNPAGGSYPDIITYKYYTLDVSNMLGFSYEFKDWSSQTLYFTLDKQYEIPTTAIPQIEVFCYGFPNTDAQKALENKDILIKNISLYAVDPISIQDEGDLVLSIKASEGLYFTDNYSETKTLIPELKYQGKNINLKITDAKIYWFKEDVSVQSNSDLYCAEGGFGWACLNQKINTVQNEDGTTSWDWMTSAYELKVNRSDFYTSSRYKCVIIYNKNKISKIITLQDLQSTAFLKLFTPMENNTFPKSEGYITILATVHVDDITDKEKYRNSIIYSWVRYNAAGELINEELPSTIIEQYNEIVDGNYVTKIKFPTYYVEGSNYIYCSAKFISNESAIREKIIGTEMIAIYTAETFDYTLIINNDNIIYKYDTNGSSPMDSAYNGPVSARVDSITPLTYTIRKKNGDELAGEEYSYIHYKWIIPKESLFVISSSSIDPETGDYIVEGYDDINHTISLPYSISKRYNKTKALGKIKLILQIGDTILSDIVKISFLKEGENGSNGTEYAAEIVGGTNSIDTSMPYGTMGANGYPVQLKFLYRSFYPFNANNSVYAYQWNSTSPSGYNLSPIDDNPSSSAISNCNCKLYVKVYENGELLTWRNNSSTDYTVEWSMLDPGKTYPCFKIHDSYKNTNFTVIQRVSELPSNANGIYCNIARAKITIKKVQGVSLGAGKDLYVYYPIDLIISSNFYGGQADLEMLGGFSEVMYGSDGYNPQYDEKNKKFLIDLAASRNYDSSFLNLEDYCIINWAAQNHLTIKGSSSYISSIDVAPDVKYDDGNTRNYVSCTVNIDGSKEEELNNRLAVLRNEISALWQLVRNENAQLSQLNTIKTSLNNYYFNWSSSLNIIKPLLNAETKGVNSLQILQKYLNELTEYVQSQKNYNNIDLENEEFYTKSQQLLTKTNNAIIIINQLGDGYSYLDLISLVNDKITFDKEYYKNNFGLNIALQLESYIKQINSQIDDYQIQYDNINNFSSTSYLNTYQSILTQIDIVINDFDESILKPEYIEVKKNLQYYRNKFKVDPSWSARTRIIEDIMGDALSPIFRIFLSSVELQPYVTEQIQNNKDNYNAQASDKGKEESIISSIFYLSGTYIRPIVIYFNRYGLNNLNVWDGNKLETHDGYLIAPQVGAGKKENDNSFTGIVIGQENVEINGSTFIKTGLFGYSSGQRSIFMNAENGSAIFGKSNGGQIVIDPASTKALLYSSNFWRNYNAQTGLPTSYDIRAYDQGGNCNKEGLLIDLSTPQIIFGNGNFTVSSGGILHAQGANISGTISASMGDIGGWIIGSTELESKNGTLHLVSTGNGYFYSNDHTSLSDPDNGFYLGSDGLSIGSKVKISSDGSLRLGKNAYDSSYGACWTINGGDDNRSYISYNSTVFHPAGNDSQAQNQEVYIGTDGINLGKKFSVDNYGNLKAENVDLTGTINSTNGKIANFIMSTFDLRAAINTETAHFLFPCDKYGNVVNYNLPVNIGFGNGVASTLAHDGGTGQIDDAVSLWVGADKDNIGLAPFRVYATGEGVFGRWIFRGAYGNDTMLYTANSPANIPGVSNKGIGLCNHASIYKTWDGTKKIIGLWVGATHEHIGDAPILLFHSGEAIMAGMLFENHCIYGNVADAVNHWRITDGGGTYTSTISIDNVCGRDGANPAFRLITDPTTGESHLYVNHIHCPDIQNS